MKKFKGILLTWSLITFIWGIFRLFESTEIISELIAKPLVWIGILLSLYKIKIIPKNVLIDLKTNFLKITPIAQIFILPILGIAAYFFLINFRQMSFPVIGLSLLLQIIINFSTATIEEVAYRGVFYVWLLKITNEATAFILLQVLFLLGHLPILLLNTTSTTDILTRSFFIILIGSIHTGIFRLNKSLYSSILSHGVWNSMVAIFLL